MNKTVLNILLFIIPIAIIWQFAYPLYSGSGSELLDRKSVQYYIARKKDLDNTYKMAEGLASRGEEETKAYQSIPLDQKNRIESSITSDFDIARTVNDLSTLARNNKLKISDIKFSKSNQVKKNNTNVFPVSFSFNLEGDYVDFKNYITSIESSLELFTIKSLAFSEPSIDNTNINKKTKFSITLESYELKKANNQK